MGIFDGGHAIGGAKRPQGAVYDVSMRYGRISGLEAENFKIDGKTLSARFFTKGVQTFFDNKWDVDVTVKAALPAAKK